MSEASTRMSAAQERFTRGIQDEIVRAKTGKGWEEWNAILDGWNALDRSFAESARLLRNEYELSAWWSNTIAARYRWARGVRA